tara:strand:- start:787 stop:915 length:129 start_codon:yes stop_codon:yes gene_type:complete
LQKPQGPDEQKARLETSHFGVKEKEEELVHHKNRANLFAPDT